MPFRIPTPVFCSITLLIGIVTCALLPERVQGQESPRSSPSADTVAEMLDTVMQARFVDPDLLKEGKFGDDRLFRLGGHPEVRIWQGLAKEQEKVKPIQESGRDFFIAFYQTGPHPAEFYKNQDAAFLERLEEQRLRHVDASGNLFLDKDAPKPAWRAIVKKEKPRLLRGQKVNHNTGDWFLALRPVPARQECLSCHKRAKEGDTLGVMFYAVSQKVRPVSQSTSITSRP